MKKFAANYLIDESGVFLKNGFVVSDDNGTALQYIDTTDDLKEVAQLTFHNGILMGGCRFLKTNSPVSESENSLIALVMNAVEGQRTFSLPDLIELGKLIQREFPEMKIPEILNVCTEMLNSNFGLVKESIPGIFLMTGVDLPRLLFKSTTKLKKII